MMKLVAQEQAGFVAVDAEEPASLGRPTEIDAADHAEGLIALAFEDRRDRQEELIDAIAAHKLPEEPGTAFGKDGAITVGMQRVEDATNADGVIVRNGAHLGSLRQCRAEPPRRGSTGQDQRSGFERGLG